MFQTHRGDTVVARMTSFEHVEPNGDRFGFKTEKGKVSIFLLIGHEDKKVQEFLPNDARDKALKETGWVRTSHMDQFAIYKGVPYRVAEINGDEIHVIDENGEEKLFCRTDSIALVYATQEEALKLVGGSPKRKKKTVKAKK